MVPPPLIYTDFFWQPLTEDVEKLLGCFQQTESLRYELFSAIWRDMGFSEVFVGIPALNELKRFCRVALATAVRYFLPPYSYQIRVGGLYLMYAFYHTQLAAPPVKIRLALKDWPEVQKFLQDSVDAGHYDVVYILKKLHAMNAIHYTAMPHFLTFRRFLFEKKEPVCAEFMCRTTRVQELVSKELLEEVTNVQGMYEKLKESLVKENGHMAMAHRDLHSRLHGCVEEFSSWQTETFAAKESPDTGDKTEADECSERAQRVARIKRNSYQTYKDVTKARDVHRLYHQRKAAEVDRGADPANNTTPAEPRKPKRVRPPSLRARTFEKLGTQEKDRDLYYWALSAPEMAKADLKQTRMHQGYH